MGATLLAAVGCSATTSPQPPVPSEVAEPVPAAVPAAVSETNAAAVEAAPPPSPASSETAVPELAKPPFIAVAQLDTGVGSIFPIDGAVLVHRPKEYQGQEFGILQGDEVEWIPRAEMAGYMEQVSFVVGRWPDQVDALVMGATGRTSIAVHRVLNTGHGWADRSAEMGSFYASVAQIGSTVIGLETPAMFGTPAIRSLRGPRLTRKLTPAPSPCGDSGWVFHTALARGAALGGTKDGHIIAAGMHCDGDATLEVWRPGETNGQIVRVPGMIAEGDMDDVGSTIVAGAAPDEAFLISGTLTHIRGLQGTVLEHPAGSLVSGATDSEGRLWVTNGKEIYVRSSEGTWKKAPMSSVATVDKIAASPDGTIWVLANGGTIMRMAKEGEDPSKGVMIAADPKPVPKALMAPRPGGHGCDHNLVVLYGFSKVTPLEYDFPLTRKALKGQQQFADVRFAVTEDKGQKFLTGMTWEKFDLAEKLSKRIEAEVQGAKPQIICADPEVLRPFPLNLATGELASP